MKRNATQTSLRVAELAEVPHLAEVASAAYERYIERDSESVFMRKSLGAGIEAERD